MEDRAVYMEFAAKYGRNVVGKLVCIKKLTHKRFLGIKDDNLSLVEESNGFIWEKGDESTQGYFTLTDPASEKSLTGTSATQLSIEDQKKYGLWGLFDPMIL